MTDSEQQILAKLSNMEEALKLLLVNDVLQDAESLTNQVMQSDTVENQQNLRKIIDLQQEVSADEKKILDLQKQIKTLKSRIDTLQQLTESKDRTIQAKEERITNLQANIEEIHHAHAMKLQRVWKRFLDGNVYHIVPEIAQDGCLRCINDSSANGAGSHVSYFDSELRNRFRIRFTSDVQFQIVETKSGKLLSISKESEVILWESCNEKCQFWSLEDAWNGTFRLISADDGNCMTVGNDQKIYLLPQNGEPSQKFRFLLCQRQ